MTCRPGRDDYERYIYTEYVIYPAYNVLTDLSFRARPARVTYVDTSGDDDTFTSNAFILEHKSQMAARNEAVPIELRQLHPGGSQSGERRHRGAVQLRHRDDRLLSRLHA